MMDKKTIKELSEKELMDLGVFTTSMNRKVCWENGFNTAIDEVLKMIDEHILSINKLRQNITSRDMLRPTEKNMQKYHVFEVTELERLKQRLEKLTK